MKPQKIGLVVLFAFLATLTIGDIRSISNFKSNIAEGMVLAQISDARKAQADRLLEQGIEQSRINQLQALQSLQQALSIYREIKDGFGERRSLGNIGLVYSSLGDYPKAIEFYQQTLAVARSIKDQRGEGNTLGNLGNTYVVLTDYPKAIAYYQQALAIMQEIKDRSGEKTVILALANAYNKVGDYPKVIAYSQQSLAISREMQDQLGEAQSLNNLGLAYYYLGNFSKAIEFHQQGLAITKKINNRSAEANALVNLGNVYLALGDYPKAIAHYQQLLDITREIKDRLREGQALANLGNVYSYWGDYPKAIAYYQQSLMITQEIKDRLGEGIALGNLGNVYYYLGDYPKAIAYLQQRLTIGREIKDRLSEAQSLGSLGLAYDALEDYPKALAYHQQFLAIAREIKDRKNEATALNNLGNSLSKSGDLAAAETTLNNAINVLESLRSGLTDDQKVSIFDTQSKSYRTLQQVLIAQNKTDTALEIAERGRSRAFVELLAKKLTSNPQQISSNQLVKPTIDQIKQIAKQQNSTLIQYSIIYDLFRIQGREQNKQSELYIWVIKPTGEVTFRRSDLKPLWQQKNTTLLELITNSRESVGAGSRGLATTARIRTDERSTQPLELQQLYQILIEPIADLLPTDPSDRVTFIPQGELFLVPFPALQDAQRKYLIQKHTILTAPSIQVLDLTHKQRQLADGKEILIVGNPNMPSIVTKLGETPQKLPSLPGAEREAETIAQLFNTKAITGNDATKLAILPLLPKARIIHLATHGLFDDFTGLGIPGAIALAPSSNDNGLLTASEILDLKLTAELVVLSACDTGRGKLTGDGVIGLSRSLISAGVPTVIVSLWAVPDAQTAALMTEFYQNLQKTPDKAQALREAMLTTMKNYPNPRDWAAFTLIGEAQ